MNDPLPNWFQVFTEGLLRELTQIKDGQIRLESKVDTIHDETRRTNGRVMITEGRVSVLERARENQIEAHQYKGQVFIGPAIGAMTGIALLVLTELLKHLP